MRLDEVIWFIVLAVLLIPFVFSLLALLFLALLFNYDLRKKTPEPLNVQRVNVTFCSTDEKGAVVQNSMYLYGKVESSYYGRKAVGPEPFEEIQKGYAAGVFIIPANEGGAAVAIPARKINTVHVGKFEEHWV